MSRDALRRKFRAEVAPRLVSAVAGKAVAPHLSPRQGTSALSDYIAYFSDKDTLYALSGTEEHHLALAHGYYQADGRRLVLVMPEGKHTTAAVCAPWLAANIALWTYGEDLNPRERQLSKTESVASFDDELAGGEPELGERQAWVEPLLTWASEQRLTPAHRQGYFAWHYEGRKVLEVKPSRRAVKVTAGVAYTRPTPEQSPPIVEVITKQLSAPMLQSLQRVVERAVKEREEGKDVANQEHRLQAWLTEHREELGLVDVQREFPAYRDGGRAFIDLLGCDGARRLHVVETKIGHDCAIVLQALEYWVWAKAHAGGLESIFKASRRDPVLQFVVQQAATARSQLLDVYSKALAAALDPAIEWHARRVVPAGRGYKVAAPVLSSLD